MKKYLLTITIVLLVIVSNQTINAQEKALTLGVGGGLTYGVNEGKTDDRTFGPEVNVLALFKNGFGEGLTPEFSFAYFTNGTVDNELEPMYPGYYQFSKYLTTHFTLDLRLRYYPLTTDYWGVYAFAGIGALAYNVDEIPWNYNPEAEFEGLALNIPVGVGLTHYFTDNFGMDFSVSLNVSSSDNLNPVWDDILDDSWIGRLSVLYDITTFAKDSDGDGLSDEEEVKIGTDPNNPDTDGDGLLDGEEVEDYNTDPNNPDTDGGGIKDGVEVANGADPLDADDDILSIKVGEKLVLRNIEFETGKAAITRKSDRILGMALKALQSAQEMEIEIIGHTDDVGDPAENLKLSEDRAISVKQWFVNKGIDESRLTTKGMGQDEPLVPNSNSANRQKNRRVEFVRTK